MNIFLPIKQFNFSDDLISYWDNNIKGFEFKESYSFSDNENKLKNFNSYLDDNLDYIISLLDKFRLYEEKNYYYDKDIESVSVKDNLYRQFLEKLFFEKIDILKIFNNSFLYLENNKNHLTSSSVYDFVYFLKIFLEVKNRNTNEDTFIDNMHFNFLINEHKKSNSFYDINHQINFYFDILNILDKKYINNDVFFSNLEYFSDILDNDGESVNCIDYLTYSSQKKIFDFVQNNFPEELNNYKKYYSNLVAENVFIQEDFFQSSLSINLIKLFDLKKIHKKRESLFETIIKESFLIIANNSYVHDLNPKIDIVNTNTKTKKSIITLYFSSNSQENLDEFKKILINSIKGVINVFDKIYYDAFDENINTNLTKDLIMKNYLNEDLKEQLSKHKSNKNKVKI